MENNLFKQLFESSPLPLVLLKIDSGECVKTNQSFKDFFSHLKNEDINFWDLIFTKKEDAKKENLIQKLKQSNKTISIKHQLFIKEEIFLKLCCTLVKETKETNENLAWIQIQKQNASNSLKQALAYKQIFENNQVGLMYTSSTRTIKKANKKLAEMFGYEKTKQLKDMCLSNLHLSEKNFIEFGKKYYYMLKDKNDIDVEYQFRKKDGTIIWCELSGKRVDSEDFSKGTLWVLKDISLRKEKEKELKKLINKTDDLLSYQNILLSIFDKGDTVLFKWNNNENFTLEYASLSAKKLFGYSKYEFLNYKIEYIDCIHKDYTKIVTNELNAGLKQGLDYFKHTPYKILTKNKKEKWVLDTTVTIKNKAGEIVSFIAYIIDITEQVRNQELLFQQLKIASMGEMLENISHQWRQPLSAISILATGSKLKKEIDVLSDNEFYENMDLINDNTQSLSKTIDNFKSFFKSDSSIQKEFEVKAIFDNIYSLIDASFKDASINIIFNIENAKIRMNDGLFIQAIVNILNNAKDALIKNDIKNKFVFVDFIKKDEYYLLTIKDNAKGIPFNIIDKVFEPYFTTKHKSQGTGIGLYMTNQIITNHLKGEICVNNIDYTYKNNRFIGASFIMKLPI